MNNLNSEPVLLAGNDGSIIIGLVGNNLIKLAEEEFLIHIQTRRLIGKIKEQTIFNFDLKNNPSLEDMVEYAISAYEEPMISIWGASDDGMIPMNNLIFNFNRE